jgi:hypothetical protein
MATNHAPEGDAGGSENLQVGGSIPSRPSIFREDHRCQQRPASREERGACSKCFIDQRECPRLGTPPPAGAERLYRARVLWRPYAQAHQVDAAVAAEALVRRVAARSSGLWIRIRSGREEPGASAGANHGATPSATPSATHPSLSLTLRTPQAHEPCPRISTRDAGIDDTERHGVSWSATDGSWPGTVS